MRKSKNRYFYHIFVSPGDAPWGNHVKCCMDGKRIRCLQIVPLHVPIYLLPFLRYSEIFVKKSSLYHTARIQRLLDKCRRPQQSGFTAGRSTMDAILALRLLAELHRNFNRQLDNLTWLILILSQHLIQLTG